MLRYLIATMVFGFTSATFAQAQNWTEKVTFSGDMRVREEAVKNGTARRDYNSRIRARLATKAKVNESMNVNLRLATAGSTTATSSNDKMTNAEAKKNFLLEIANIELKPLEKWTLGFGKSPNPFYTAGKNEMVWDSDLTFEGITSNYNCQCDKGSYFFNLVASQVQDRTTTAQDTTLLGLQLGAARTAGDVKYTLAAASYNYNLVKGQAALGGGFLGNTNDGTNYLNEYEILEVGGEVEFQAMGMPLVIFADYATNSDPDDENTATIYGFRLGNTKEVHSWILTYDYRTVEADSVLATMNDSDFAGGGTDAEGHKVYAQYIFAENSHLGLSYFGNTKGIAANTDTGYERWMLDFGVKF